MTQPLGVGIVGYGFATKTFHAPLVASVPGLRLIAIASRDEAKVHADWPAIDVADSPEALFARKDIDLVVIPTPNLTHHPLAEKALAAGKHVVVDKPFTVTSSAALALQASAKASGRLLSVFHNRRWDADFLTLKQVLASGELGRLVHFESHFDRYRPEVRHRWREQALPGSGLWYDLGSHLLDQTLQLFGPPQSIWLDLSLQREAAQSDDWFHAVLRYDELRVILHASALTPVPAPRFVVHGSKGSFTKYGLDPQEEQLKSGTHPSAPDWGNDPVDAHLTTYDSDLPNNRRITCLPGDYPAYYAAVRDAILYKGEPPVSASEATEVITWIERGVESATSGATVRP